MPDNIPALVFMLGAVLILIALLGGSFKIFGADIPMKLKGRTRIVAGILGTVLIVFSLAVFTIQNFSTISKPAGSSNPPGKIESPPEPPNPSPEPSNLNEEQIRLKITNLLHEGKIKEAFDTLRTIREGEVKSEECERVFSYCIKNHSLSAAKDIAIECWKGEQREKAFSEIEKESLKSS